MKRLILIPALCLCLLAACAAPPAPLPVEEGGAAPLAAADRAEAPAPPAAEDTVYLSCRIVDGAADGELLLAELERGVVRGEAQSGTGVYRLCLTPDISVTVDGETAGAAGLEDGMPVEIAYNGAVEETFPARLCGVRSVAGFTVGTRQSPGGGFYDLCGLYLQVLDDLWNRDAGLNGDITLAALDLSRAPGGLTESEKSALAWRFGELHGAEVLTAGWEELREQGYLTACGAGASVPAEGEVHSGDWYEWRDGCLFSIRPNDGHEGEAYSLPILFFDAEKYRSPLGAYCLFDCSALWPEMGSWSGYSIGGEMIS